MSLGGMDEVAVALVQRAGCGMRPWFNGLSAVTYFDDGARSLDAAADVVVRSVEGRLTGSGMLDVETLDAASSDLLRGWSLLCGGRNRALTTDIVRSGAEPGITGDTIRWMHVRTAAAGLGAIEDAELGQVLIRRTRHALGLAAVDTAERFRDLTQPADPWIGPLMERRLRLHESYVSSWVSGIEPPTGVPPTEVMIIGVPGAGKSVFATRLHEQYLARGGAHGSSIVMVDADHAKHVIPEYADLVRVGDPSAGTLVHRESTLMADRLQRRAEALGLNLIVQRSGRRIEDLEELHDVGVVRGYRTALYVVDVETDTAIARAAARAQLTGRHIDPALIRGVSGSVASNTLEALDDANLADQVFVVAGDEAGHVVARRLPGRSVEVFDEGRLRRIAERAGRTSVAPIPSVRSLLGGSP